MAYESSGDPQPFAMINLFYGAFRESICKSCSLHGLCRLLQATFIHQIVEGLKNGELGGISESGQGRLIGFADNMNFRAFLVWDK